MNLIINQKLPQIDFRLIFENAKVETMTPA